MKRIAVFVLVVMLLTGCGVSRKKVVNWHPNDSSRGETFYECLKQAQQEYSSAAFAANQYGAGGGASSGAKTNYDLLDACMNAKGYQLRMMKGGEVVVTLITIPLSFSFILLGGGESIVNFY